MLHGHESRTRRRAPGLRWALLAAPIISAFAALMPGQAFAVAPPAFSNISSAASATYTDSGSSHTVYSNTVSTSVQAVYSHDLSSDRSVSVNPGNTVTFFHSLKNTGNADDTYTLSAFLFGANTAGLTNLTILAANCSTAQVSNTPITLGQLVGAGKELCFGVSGSVASSASTGSSATVRVGAAGNPLDLGNYTASATAPTAPQIANTDTATVTAGATFEVSQSISPNTGPGTQANVTITLSYRNTSTTAAPLVITSLLGQARQALPHVPGTYTDTANMCYVNGSATDSSTGTANISFTASSPPAGSPCTGSNESGNLVLTLSAVAANSSGQMTFKVNIKNAVYRDEHASNAAEFGYGSSPVTYGASNAVSYSVLNAGTAPNVAITDTAFGSDTTNVGDGNAHYGSATQGTTQFFRLKVTNTGDGNDSATLAISTVANTFPAGTSYSWLKTDGAGNQTSAPMAGGTTPETDPLTSGSSTQIILRIDLPTKFISASAVALTVIAKSKSDPSKTSTVLVTLDKVVARTVDVSPGSSSSDGQFSGTKYGTTPTAIDPDGTFTVKFTVTNPGTMPSSDNFDLSLVGTYNHSTSAADTSTALPSTWKWTITTNGGSASCASPGSTVSNTGTILVGDHCDFIASVTVPAGFAAGNFDVSVKVSSPTYFVDSGTLEADYDVMLATVTINKVARITVSDPGSLDIIGGDSGTQLHKICNTGNVDSGQISLTSSNSTAGWDNDVYISPPPGGPYNVGDTLWSTQSGLVAGACIYVNDKVNAPHGTAGEKNETSLDFTINWPSMPSTSVSMKDSSTISTGNLKATKGQAVVAVGAATWPSSFTSSVLAAQLPGTIIGYEVTLTNRGANQATSVTISDSVPAYTTIYTTGQCAPKLVNNGVTAPAPTVSGTTVVSSAFNLNGGQSAKMTYCVRIDQ